MNNSDVLSIAMAKNTKICYAKGWQKFADWCHTQSIQPLQATPDHLADFFLHLARTPRHSNATTGAGTPLKISTLKIYRSAICRRFKDADLPSPTAAAKVDLILRGLERSSSDQVRQVKALRETDIIAMIDQCDYSLLGVRNAAILALGFSCALRRSEICALRVDDLRIIELPDQPPTMVVTIRRSKTDQAGKGQTIPVVSGKKIKPIDHIRGWLKISGIQSGYLFRSLARGGHLRGNGERQLHHSDIPRIVKTLAAKIGIDPSEVSGHSLRAGFITSAAAHNARLDKIMEISRHTNPQTVMKYIRDANRFTDHAGAEFL